jgi:hypothetical protein
MELVRYVYRKHFEGHKSRYVGFYKFINKTGHKGTDFIEIYYSTMSWFRKGEECGLYCSSEKLVV